MNKFFNGVLSGNADLGRRIYDACVQPADKVLWCGGRGMDECLKEEENRQWRPAFIGVVNPACQAVLDQAKAQSVSSTKKLRYTMGKRPGGTDLNEPLMCFYDQNPKTECK
jgi:hypothetical protein